MRTQVDFTGISVEILDEIFESNGITFPQTANVIFLGAKEVAKENPQPKTKRYGYLPVDEIYKKILQKQEVVLNKCYVKNFSLTDYRKQKGLEPQTQVEIFNFSAHESLFHSDAVTDFSNAHFECESTSFNSAIFINTSTQFVKTQFGDGDDDFEKCTFVNGNVSFANAVFGKGNVSFKDAYFGNGRKNFDRVDFGEGELIFNEAYLSDGDIAFTNVRTKTGNVMFNSAYFGDSKLDFSETDFGDGNISFLRTVFASVKITFKNTVMGNGKLDFHYAKFKKAVIVYERTNFGDGVFDFRAAVMDEGNIRFRKSLFGDGDIDFEAIEIKKGTLTFEECTFGKGDFKFESAHCLGAKVMFENINFGGKDLWFKQGEFDELTIKSCQLNDFVDLRVNRCNALSITDCIVRDILDMRADKAPVKLGKLDLSSMRLLGRIYLDWHGSKVKERIYTQDTTHINRSEQFRMLKQNFNTIGNYAEEDEAYVEFKRAESQAIRLSITENAQDARLSFVKKVSLYLALKKLKNVDEKIRGELIQILRKENLAEVSTFNDIDFLVRRHISFDKEKVKHHLDVLELLNVEEQCKRKPIFAKTLADIYYIFRVIMANISYWGQKIVFDKVGLYATNPVRVLASMFVVYVIFSLLYTVMPLFEGPDIITTVFTDDSPNNLPHIGRAFYMSAITFLTIGYGDFVPIGFSRVLAGLEGFTGVFLMSYFTVAFVRKILR